MGAGGNGSVLVQTAPGLPNGKPALDRPSKENGGFGAAHWASSQRRASGATVSSTEAPAQPELRPEDAEAWSRHEPVTEIDKRDKGTPDEWVPRHPELIRLTGRHPFNCEPPPDALMKRGMLTPVSLHYVRNHGPVPRLEWGTHRVSVGGLVSQPHSFSMDDIVSLPSVTITATLVCAGNRRKEQNMVKKTKGFNWGPAATACTEWTGVRMSTLLKLCGVQSPAQGANYVCFNGPEKELPQGDTTYGTSLLLEKAMYDGNDILVAYKQNGRWLTPDHGFPVRMIIPGHIGGRMVKWLTSITVTEKESDNFYHYHDNRVMPPHVDAKLADEEGWWFNPDWIINELGINSTITSPAHEEIVTLDTQKEYVMRGYAYSNGTKVTRCEVSLDDGKSWRFADIQRVVPPNAAGKHWCWVHYSLSVPVVDLMQAQEICCRAYDASQNSQPNTFTWNLMGMMNNCLYRVKVHPTTTEGGQFALQFEHPTLASSVGGWMNRADKVVEEPKEEKKGPPKAVTTSRKVTMAEVEAHASKESAWFVRDGLVYDGTPFMKDHPGGADSILIVAGQEASDEFNAIHSSKAKAMLDDYLVGELTTDGSPPADAQPSQNGVAVEEDVNGQLVALNSRKRIKFALAEKEELSHNVRRLRFALQSPKHVFGLPVGHHVFLYAKVNGELVVRAYSPVSSNDDTGYFELVIKVYAAGVDPKFPDGGKMSCHLDSLQIGDTIEAKGPMGHVTYQSCSKFLLHEEEHEATHWSMIAGGTGITPVLQIIHAVLKDPEDKTQISLLYANQTSDDILLRERLDELAAQHDNFRVWHTISRPKEGEDWQYSTGYVNEAMVKEHLFPAGPTTFAGICGPPAMVNTACVPNLEKLGYAKEHCIIF